MKSPIFFAHLQLDYPSPGKRAVSIVGLTLNCIINHERNTSLKPFL